MTVAPPILSGTPGSFAHGVFHDRHPKLIDQVIAALPYQPVQQAALRQLLEESVTGVLEPLTEDTADRAQWLEWGREFWGRPWGEVPFLWSESYFYRRLLEATGYFQPGPWHGIDPFGPTKTAELASPAATDEIHAVRDLPNVSTDKQRDALLISSLWGNQADLGFQLTASGQTRTKNLIIDDSHTLWATLTSTTNPMVCIIADNSGRELLPDLILIDHLLTTGLACGIRLYLKPNPYYVSDATMADLLATIQFLDQAPVPEARHIGGRLRQAVTDDRLVIRTHEFFCAPLSYHHQPADLATEFATATTTILKGDLNYRRLVGDNHWPPTTEFDELVAYFPSPVTALRTLKSDVIVGLTPAHVEQLDSTRQTWRTNGEYAVIQSS